MNSCSAPPAAMGFVWLLGAGLRTREWVNYWPWTDTFPWNSTTVVLRQLFSLTVAGAASGLCKEPIARTDFSFHRAARSGDGTLSKRSYVSDGEVHCQSVCL